MPDNRNAPATTGANPDDDLQGSRSGIDLTAEYATVGAVVLAASAVQDQVLGIVADDDFSDPRCNFTIDVIRRMRVEGLPVDMVTIVGYVNRHALLAGGMPRVNLASWLHETTGAAPVPVSAPYYAELVVEASARRAAEYAGRRIAAAAADGSLTDLQAIVTAELTAVTAAVSRVGSVHHG